jgi:inorganic triphosphatase YgiF
MMKPNQPTEIELKLSVAWSDVAQLTASPVWTDQEPRTLTSIYFDTVDQHLRRAGLTLRLRAGIQTLKVIAPEAAGLFERAEWEHPVQGQVPDLSLLSQTPLATVDLGANRLQPVFLIRVDRRTALIRPTPDCQIELALDIGRVEAGGRVQDFAELELELLEGPTRALFDLALSMAVQTRLLASSQSKADRGFALLANDQVLPLKAESRLDLSGLSVGRALSAMVREGLGHILHNAALVRQNREVEALHQIRVALRRLRATLGLFKAAVADQAFIDMRSRLRSLSQTMGRARDLDVLIALIETSAQPSARLVEALILDRGEAYDEVCRVLASHVYGQTLLMVMAWVETGDWRQSPWSQASLRYQPVLDFADQALERLRRKLKADGKDLTALPAEAQHRVRIRAKNLRYGMEVFASLYSNDPQRRRHLIDAVKQVQDRLGLINDRAVGEALLRAHANGPAAFDAGQALANLYVGQNDAALKAEQALRLALGLPRFWSRP